jgi:acyl-ACP thioesterase
MGDVTATGRERLDAIARHLQDISNDDTRDAALADDLSWVVRRAVIRVQQFPVFGELLELATFCGGLGARWAERRISIRGDQGAAVEASTLWVCLDPVTLRPTALSPEFSALFGESAGGRVVRPKLSHPDLDADAPRQSWHWRHSDLDLFDHVNNAAAWVVLEEFLADDIASVVEAEVEFRSEIEAGAGELAHRSTDAGVTVWVLAGSGVRATATVCFTA